MEITSNINEINTCIERSDLFELRCNKDYSELTESINSISFGHNKPNIYLTITNFGQTVKPDPEGKLKVFNYDLNLDNLDIIIHEGLELILYDRSGNILYKFKFVNCKLEDIAEQKLNYNLDDKFKTYIISISYEQLLKS